MAPPDRVGSDLLRSPANVRRLTESLDQAQAGRLAEHELDR